MAINVDSVGNSGGFTPNFKPDCSDRSQGGTASTRYDYIQKAIFETGYPDDACTPYYHSNAKIDNLQVTQTLGTASVTNVVGATGTFSGLVSAGSFSANSKSFDIPHPTKEGKRLVHGCFEGPEFGVYVRGRLENESVIILPDYWENLVDFDSITVYLTQIGSSQDLMVERIEPGNIHIKSGNGSIINCFYNIQGTRKDIPDLEVEQDA